MAKKPTNNHSLPASVPASSDHPAADQSAGGHADKGSNLDTCLKVLAGIQDQIRFADAKAAFVFGINTLMFGFVVSGVGTLKKGLAVSPVPAAAWVGLVALIVFATCAVAAVSLLIVTVMSRFGALAPKSRVFFGHIATGYGKDYGKYVAEVKTMSEDDWLNDVGTQIVEISHIALTKHSTVRTAAFITIGGFACWVIAVFSFSLLPGT